LKKLFCSKAYLTDGHKKPYHFWLPILALFTGARQNELAQLFLSDIRENDGLWVIDINANNESQKVKTKSGKGPFMILF
jgi:hypothetical protein